LATAVHVGHERGALFVPRQHELNRVAGFQRDHEVGILFAGDAEYVLDALGGEAA